MVKEPHAHLHKQETSILFYADGEVRPALQMPSLGIQVQRRPGRNEAITRHDKQVYRLAELGEERIETKAGSKLPDFLASSLEFRYC